MAFQKKKLFIFFSQKTNFSPTFNLKSISAEYSVFSQLIVTFPPNSIVNRPIKIPLQFAYGIVIT